MSNQESSDNVINLNELKEIMDDDMELIEDCFAEFLKDWPISYVEIKTAISENNAADLDSAAHKLKGTLRYLAAEPAAEAAFALEVAGKNNEMNGIEDKLSQLKSQCSLVVDYINNFSA